LHGATVLIPCLLTDGSGDQVDVPVSDDGVIVGAVRATSSRVAAWIGIMPASLIMTASAGATLGMV